MNDVSRGGTSEYYIGLISGTSRDGIDAVVAEFGDRRLQLHASHSYPYPDDLSAKLAQLVDDPDAVALDVLGDLHAWIGETFGDAAVAIAERANLNLDDIAAIGSHGQTVRHGADAVHPFSLQLGCAARIAERSGVTTVADFRAADIAAGGQGAPLVPPFHDWLFGRKGARIAIANIGGIANLTLLDGAGGVTGFDTGPGNTLMDAWIRRHRGKPFDDGGRWAASAAPDAELLEAMRDDPYFARPAPKSTGFEYFNLDWLAQFPPAEPASVQASLMALTATTLADALRAADSETLLVCGGGAHNKALMQALGDAVPGIAIDSTLSAGLDPDWVEATAFAWLARKRLLGEAGNLPDVTGARRPVCLGAIYPATA